MERHEFSNGKSLKSAEYDPATGRVNVEFASGDKKAHAALTPEEWAEWLATDAAGGNPGQWYHSKIRQRSKAHPEIPPAGVQQAPAAPPIAPQSAASAPVGAASIASQPAPITPQPAPIAPQPSAAPAEPAYKTALARARASHQRKS